MPVLITDVALPMLKYVPPVQGADLAVWVGMDDDRVARTNQISGRLLDVSAMPQVTSPMFRTVTTARYLTADVHRLPGARTFMAVIKAPVRSGSVWASVVSNERNVAGGRAGHTFGSGPGDADILRMNFAPASGNPYADATQVIQQAPRFLIAKTQLVGAETQGRLFNMTDGRVSPAGSWTKTSEPTAQAASDEAAFPYRIGANYLGTNNSAELAFIASFPFVTTTAQDGAMYDSVRSILAASGVTV